MPQGIKVETPCRPKSASRVSTSRRLVRSLLKSGRIVQPEPYKGKGVRYSDEVVVIKETKKK
jgi:large subunit ribosomal protein L6